MNPAAFKEIQELSHMTVGRLQEKYLTVFGEPTQARNKDFLRKRLAWRMQALAEGDLSERARKRAEELANDADLRIRSPRHSSTSASTELMNRSVTVRIDPGRDNRLPLPGTLLAREFKGKTIVAKVLDNGFEYEGRLYRSLSAIAFEATGSRWNGFLFFGLKRAGKENKQGCKSFRSSK